MQKCLLMFVNMCGTTCMDMKKRSGYGIIQIA